jgi:phosphocarrier protein
VAVTPAAAGRQAGDPPLSLTNQDAMNGQPLQQSVLITNPEGLHMRPLTAFAQFAARFQSTVTVSRDGRSVNGKSPWDMMTMLSPPGSTITLEVDGPDAPDAFGALVAMLTKAASEEDSPDPCPRKAET